MSVPIVCLNARLCQFADAFAGCFSAPQRRHFVAVLLARLLCREPRMLTGRRRQVAGGHSVAALSRFLDGEPCSADAVATTWWARFAEQGAPLVAAEHRRQRAGRAPRRGRPPATVVTGSLIGDDSTLHKPKGKKMEGAGRHYSITLGKPVVGHSLVQRLYVVQGRRCPLAPRLYRQRAVCSQVVIVREARDAPLSQARSWACSDLTADAATLVGHIAVRWQVEIFFADAKEVLGLDQYQLLTAAALVRFWTLMLAAYAFLEQEQARLQQTRPEHVTPGAVRRAVQPDHQ